MASERTIAKLEARIHERVAYCLDFEIADPRAGMITVTGVKLSSDLSVANVRFTVLGDSGERTKAEHMLASAAGFIQRQLGRVLDMRRTPTLKFHYDESLDEARRVDRLIADALQRDTKIKSEGRAPVDSGTKAGDSEAKDESSGGDAPLPKPR